MISQPTALDSSGPDACYSIYGTYLASHFPFANRLAPARHPPELTFSCVAEPPTQGDWLTREPIYASANRIDDRQSFLYVYRGGDFDVLRFSEVADFYVWPDQIVCHLVDPAYDFMVEIHLLGFVLSYWLERQGILALHAAAVVVEERGVAFLASNKGGKSSLAASLMQLGHPLLTDDILPVEGSCQGFIGRPGYPQMRMWPDQAEHFVGQYEALEVVHPRLSKRRVPVGPDRLGSFCGAAQPLACIYVPERREGGAVEVVPLSLGEAVFVLAGYSFLLGIVEAAGWQQRRFQAFTQLAQQVPVRRIVYPNGVEHLPIVRQAILGDLAHLNGKRSGLLDGRSGPS
jgi:hypothetical protein